METKDILAAAYLSIATMGGTIAACVSQRLRDLMFFGLVMLATMTDRWDVNFVSREWYRGTTMGFEISLVDTISLSLLAACFLVPRSGERRFYWPAGLGWILLFLFFTAMCVAIADPKLFGMFSVLKLLRGLVMFLAVALYVRTERELRIFLWALAAIVCYQGLLAVEQRYRFGIHRVFADLDAPNSLSMYMCTAAPLFVAAINSRLSKWLKLACGAAICFAGLSVLLTISRTGVVTLGIVLLATLAFTMTWKFTARKVLIGSLVVAATVGALAKSWESLSSRFGEATLEEEYKNARSQGRGYYIRLAVMMAEEHWLGVGPNNWSFWVSNKYGPRLGYRFAPYPSAHREPKFKVEADANVDDPQAAPAHSLGALTLGEMGWAGLFVLLLLWLRWFQMGASFLFPRVDDPMQRVGVGILFGLCGNFLQSLTEWVFYQTPIFYTVNILLGVLGSLYWRKRQARRAERRQADWENRSDEEVAEAQIEEDYARHSPA